MRDTFCSKTLFCVFSILERKKRKSTQKPEIPRKNANFRTFSPFRENELKIPIKGIGFNRPWEPCAFFAFWSEKGGKVRFFAKKCDFRGKVQNFGKFRLFGPEITFWAPRDPRTLVKWSAGVRIRVHFSGRKRGEGGRGGGYFLLSSPPHLLLSDSPPLTPPLLTSETYSVPQRCEAPCGT